MGGRIILKDMSFLKQKIRTTAVNNGTTQEGIERVYSEQGSWNYGDTGRAWRIVSRRMAVEEMGKERTR